MYDLFIDLFIKLEQTENVFKSASEIKATGTTGAYNNQFENMEKKISEIRNILQTTTKSSTDLQTLNNVIDQLRYFIIHQTLLLNIHLKFIFIIACFITEYRINLTTMDQLNVVTKTIDNTMQRVILANLTLGNLNAKAINLKETAQSLKNNSTQLQERNVEGKKNIIKS